MNPTILQVMTELTALSPTGVVIIKPFRSWFNIPIWQDRKIGIRLLNAGEIAKVMEYISNAPTTSQDIELKIEIVSQSLWSIDGNYVANKEDLDSYNEYHKTDLNELEYKRIMVRNFEHYLIEHLYKAYEELQAKQSRKIFGTYLCAVTNNTFTKIPEGSKKLLFNTAEIICPEGLKLLTNHDKFDFDEVASVSKHEDSLVENTKKSTIKEQRDFPTMSDYQDYLLQKAEEKLNAGQTEIIQQ